MRKRRKSILHGPGNRRPIRNLICHRITRRIAGVIVSLALIAGLLFLFVAYIPYRRDAARIAQREKDLPALETAISKYRKLTGSYPESLEDILGHGVYLTEIPRDPWSREGKPYCYRQLEDGAKAIVYSVGPDGVDHGGLRDSARMVLAQSNGRADMLDTVPILIDSLKDTEDNGVYSFLLALRLYNETLNPNRPGVKSYIGIAVPPDDAKDPRNYTRNAYKAIAELVHKGITAPTRSFALSYDTPLQMPEETVELVRILGIESLILAREGHLADSFMLLNDSTKLVQFLDSIPDIKLHRLTQKKGMMVLETTQMMVNKDLIPPASLPQLIATYQDYEHPEHLPEAVRTYAQVAPTILYDEIHAGGRGIPRPSYSYGMRIKEFFYKRRLTKIIEKQADIIADLLARNASIRRCQVAEDAIVDSVHWDGYLARGHPRFVEDIIRQRVHYAHSRGFVITCGLKIYRDRNGKYPESLEALEEILGEVPSDPFSGKPFHYVTHGNAYKLYSVGPDESDDGGTPAYQPSRDMRGNGDIVIAGSSSW